MLPLPPEMHHRMTLDQHDALRRQMADERLAIAAAKATDEDESATAVDQDTSWLARIGTASIFGWLRARSL